MSYFNQKIQELKKEYAFDEKIDSIDYSIINDAEIEAENIMRNYASDNKIDITFEIWEDGVTNSELSEDQVHILNNIYLDAFEKYLKK